MTQEHSPRLFLVAAAGPQLEALLQDADWLAGAAVDCVWIRGAATAFPAPEALVPLVRALQGRDIAVLLDDPSCVRTVGADGVHVRLAGDIEAGDGAGALAQALKAMKPDLIVGAGGLRSRHAAMSAGEEEVDYVMFGEPGGDGGTPPLETVCERVAWWAEVFTIACVAWAPRLDAVGPLAAAGADFVALDLAAPDVAANPAAAIAAATQALRENAPAGEEEGDR